MRSAFLLVCAVLLSAFFSGTETALMSVNRYRLRHLAREGSRSARIAEKLLERPDRLIGMILICNNFVNSAAAAIVTRDRALDRRRIASRRSASASSPSC